MSEPASQPPPSPWHHHSLLRQFNMIERVPTPRFPTEIAPIIEQTLKLDEPEEKENMASNPSPSSSSCTTLIRSSSAHHLTSSSLIRPIHPTIHDPSELVHTFTHVLREMVQQNASRATHQDKMNHVNGQLHAMSFFLNYANAARGKQMMENYHGLRREIASGRELLESMATVVASQDRALKSMTAEVERLGDVTERQGRAYTDLDARVEQQKRDLLAAMEEYDEKLSQQEAAISRQDALLQRLLSVRFRMDFGIDLIILLCSYWISHSRLLSFIIRNGAYLILPRPNLLYAQQRRRNVEAFIQLIRLFTFLGVARRLRHAAVHYGLHNLVGNYSQYGRVALSSVQSASVALVSAAPTDVYSQVMLMSQTVTSGIKSVAMAAIGWDQDENIKSPTLTYKSDTPTHGKYPSLKQIDPVTPLPPFKVPRLQLPESASIQTYSSSPSPTSSCPSPTTHSQHPTCPHSPP